MISNYIKIILRNLQRHRFYFAINVLGLGVALACCIIAYLNYSYDRGFDTMHLNTEDVYRVTCVRESNQQVYGFSPTPVAQMAKADLANVTDALSIDSRSANVKYGEQVFSERLHFSQPNYFDFFTFPLLYGNLEVLADPGKIILGEKTAKKYFGERNPVGETITIYAGSPYQKEMVVGAVTKEMPLNSSISFRFLAHSENYYYRNKAWDAPVGPLPSI